MINYHFTWKLELKVQLRNVEQYIATARRSGKEEDFTTASTWLEHFILHAAFDVRRLGESGRLAPSVWNQRIPVLQFARRRAPARAGPGTKKQELSRLYDFTKGVEADISFRWLCNELIHSSILLDCVPQGEMTRLVGFVVTSPKDERVLNYVEVDQFFSRVERCCDDGWEDPPEPKYWVPKRG